MKEKKEKEFIYSGICKYCKIIDYVDNQQFCEICKKEKEKKIIKENEQ